MEKSPFVKAVMGTVLPHTVSVRITDKLFEGRTGHGGGPCTKRVLNWEELRIIIEAVYKLGMDAGKKSEREQPPEKYHGDPIKWEGYEGFNPEFTGYTAGHYSTGQPERGWCLFVPGNCWEQRTKPLLPPVPGAQPVRREGAWRWLLP